MGQASQGPEVTDLFPRQLPFPVASVHGKGSHKYLDPRLNGIGGTAPEREEASPHTAPLAALSAQGGPDPHRAHRMQRALEASWVTRTTEKLPEGPVPSDMEPTGL